MTILKESIPKGQGFFVEMLLEAGDYKLIKLRCPLRAIEWNGEWAHASPKWNDKVIQRALKDLSPEERAVVEDQDFSFWMSMAEAVSFFGTLSVCRVKDWHEVRLPGKFMRVFDTHDESYDAVLSKWFYHIEVNRSSQRVFITVQ